MLSAIDNRMVSMLFGLKQSQQQVAALAQPAVAVPGGSAAVAAASDGGGSAVSDPIAAKTRAWAEGLKAENAQMEEKVVAALARDAAKEAADAERGFRQRATPELRATQRDALRVTAGEAGFDSRAEARREASSAVSRIRTAVSSINSVPERIAFHEARAEAAKTEGQSFREPEIRIARAKDSAKAERMVLDIQASHLRGKFSMTARTFSENADGTVSHMAYEVRH